MIERYRIEEHEKWRDAIKTIPFIKFPADWQVQVIPPFGSALLHYATCMVITAIPA